MIAFRYFMFIALILLSSGLTAYGANDEKPYRIFHVMSYHFPWIWTDNQLSGFKDALNGINVEIRVHQLDGKRNSDPHHIAEAAQVAQKRIEQWKPDLLYVSDDLAQEYVAKTYLNTPLPIVFSGVNAQLSAYGYDRANNVTGALEREHIAQTLSLFKKLVPNARKLAVVMDVGMVWPGMIGRIRDTIHQSSDFEIVHWDTIQQFETFKEKMSGYHESVDAVALIGIFNMTDIEGQNVPYLRVLKWVAENSHLPDLSFWQSRVLGGTLCAVGVSGYEQGYLAGLKARQILSGEKKPLEIPMEATKLGEGFINTKRLKALGIKPAPGVLENNTLIAEYEWIK